MSTLAPIRWTLVAIILGAAGTAAAQNPPQAKCPQPDTETGECPPPTETPTAEPVEQMPPPPPEPIIQDPEPTTTPTYTPPPATTPVYTSTEDTLERYGVSVSLGGGVSGFTSETMRDTTHDGGAWGVNVAIGTRSPLAIEAAYIGSAQSIDALGLESDAVLLGNGLQAGVRVNLLDSNLQPFGFAGIAWRRYSLADEGINTSDVADDDDVLEIPVGVGIAWKYRGFLLDARGEFRLASQEDMVPRLQDSTENASMHRYGVTANVGYAF